MTPAKTATRPTVDELPMGEPLPEELQITPPTAPVVEQTYAVLPIDAIVVNPDNPRQDLGDIEGLAASMRSLGVQEPLLVEWPSPTSPYLLLAGHRRLAAARLAGLQEVPCLVRQVASTAALRMEIALVENLQREDLTPLDEARGYLALTKLGLSQRQITERLGHQRSQSHVSKRMALLELPKPVQAQVGNGALTLEAAAALVRLKDHPEKLEAVAKEKPSRVIEAVEYAEKEIAWLVKRDELVAIAAGRSWPVVDCPRDSYSKRPFKLLAQWGYSEAELDLDVHKHEAEPCHAVMIPTGRIWPHHDAPSATSVCTDPARHDAGGESTLKAKVEPKAKQKLPAVSREQARLAKERQQAMEQRDAAASARRVFIVKHVEGFRPPKLAPALRVCLNSFLTLDYDQDDACALLGLNVDDAKDTYDALVAYAAKGDQELQRAALAIALSDTEGRIRNMSQLPAEGVAHYAYLATLGYEPSPWEKTQLAEAAERAKAVDGG